MQMTWSGHNIRERDGAHLKTRVGALTINTVEEYKYLGAVLKNDLSWDHIVKERAEAGRGALGGLTKCLTNRQIPTWVKLRIVKSILMPHLLYGAEVWRMATQRVTPLEKIANRALKSVYGTRGNAPANAMRAEASMLPEAVMAATRRAAALGRLAASKTVVGGLIRGEFKHPEWT
ncbi:hypothetical protein HZS_2937 [Henneguya salminicola]|nr:hypothetical protein HZS_2937 [Henneguya salminicola]